MEHFARRIDFAYVCPDLIHANQYQFCPTTDLAGDLAVNAVL